VPEQNIEWARESAARTPEKGLGKATPEVIDGSGACQSPALDCRCSLNRLEPLFSGRAGKKGAKGKKGLKKLEKPRVYCCMLRALLNLMRHLAEGPNNKRAAAVQPANVLHRVHFLFALQIKTQHMLFN